MEIRDSRIDGGKAFDWGKTAADYARYRDIYPRVFYDKILSLGLCVKGQRVLDLGTGTGVLPRNLYTAGADWTATDISPEQIAQARRLSQGMTIDYRALPAEQIDFPDHSFDVVTACQCLWYFDHETLAPKLYRMLRGDGAILLLYMAWLPEEDPIAGESERLVLRYSPGWSGAGESLRPIDIPPCYLKPFTLEHHEEYRLPVRFTRESWHGRMKACRGVGASLTPEELRAWEAEHQALLLRIAPEEFDVQHYAALAVLRKREEIS